MKHWKTDKLQVNGFEFETKFNQDTVESIFLPMLAHFTAQQAQKQSRFIVFLSAPPAVGKTTLSLYLEKLSGELPGIKQIQALGLDGFHHHNDYLCSHSGFVNGRDTLLMNVKGCPETYDIDKLTEKLILLQTQNVTWPIYDRNIHDVVEDALRVEGDILLLEGNWLLLDEDRWRNLKQYCDYSIHISADEDMLKERLIRRKMLGGLSRDEALRFYLESDSQNVRRVLKNVLPCDMLLAMEADGDYQRTQ